MSKRKARRPTSALPSGPSRALDVAALAAAVEQFAPRALAAEWDNVGLLAGRPEWPARRVLVALDLTDAVAAEALRTRADALVLYHPPIFKGIRTITPDADAPTTRLPDLLAARVSLLALHTALDAADGGTNDVLLDAFDVVAREPLQAAAPGAGDYKLVVFVPREHVAAMRAALAAAGAGVIGHYDECSFELDGHGTFRGDATTHPTVGQRGRLERVAEARLELVLPRARTSAAIRALYAAHPYEEPAFDVYPLHTVAARGQGGLGLVGTLRRATRGATLLAALRRIADLSTATVVGALRRRFTHVIAAAGAFGIASFRDPAALVITGEFKHHDALALLKRGVTAVVLGHAASERPVLPRVVARLRTALPGARVALSRADRGPLVNAEWRIADSE